MGVMASMLWWPDEFCERLAGAGRYAIRYDNRDTGRSTGYEPGTAAYTIDDMAGDAVAALDEHGAERAHVVGMSMGGLIAQLVARDLERAIDPGRLQNHTVVGDDEERWRVASARSPCRSW